MKFLNKILILMTVSLSIIACTPAYYLPTKQHVQVFEQKGDIVVSGNLGMYGTIGADAGYAFTDHLGVYSSFNGFNISSYGGSENKVVRDYIWDNEFIYYTKLKYDFYAACNAGIGFGEFDVNNAYYKLRLNRQFIQPSIGLTVFDHFQTSFSSRITRLDYDINSYIAHESAYDNQMLRDYFMFGNMDERPVYFAEPAITMGVNLGNFKTQIQYSGLVDLGGPQVRNWNQNFILSFSFNISSLISAPKH